MPLTQISVADTEPLTSERHARRAMVNGWRRKCPNCGDGALLHSYLKVHDTCPSCRQDLYHHRADDGPAYLTILLVGKIMTLTLYYTFVTFRPDPLVLFGIFAVGSVALALYFLPRLKGAIVGYQWARGMGGFAAVTRASRP